MNTLLVTSWIRLLKVSLHMKISGYHAVRKRVANTKTQSQTPPVHSIDQVCDAISMASVFSLFAIPPLHRAIATVLALRAHGWRGEVVIGIQILPLETYTWVEVGNNIVAERADSTVGFSLLDRY